MTTAADDSAVEDAFEALLAGRPGPEGAAGLAAFTEAVRTSATRPGRPNAALAELLATGLLTDQSSPSVRTATSAGSAPQWQPSRVRTRRRTTVILSALIAKFLSAGALAQAATGATVAVVAFTGVGAVGALPDPVQDTFATVVSEITPIEPPTSDGTTEETTEEVVQEETVAEEAPEVIEDAETVEDVAAAEAAAVEAEVRAWALEGPAEGESFSAWVGEGSKDQVKEFLRARGLSFGNVVSAWANGKGFSDAELVALGADLDQPIVTPAQPETGTVVEEVPGTQPEVAATVVEPSRGNGKATGNGNGKSNGHSNGKSNGQGNGNGNGKN